MNLLSALVAHCGAKSKARKAAAEERTWKVRDGAQAACAAFSPAGAGKYRQEVH